MIEWSAVAVRSHDTVRDVMARIDASARGIAVAVDDDRRLLGTITDGDIRRAILAGMTLEQTTRDLLQRRSSTSPSITARESAPSSELIRTMRSHGIRHIVLLGPDDRVAGVACLEDFLPFTGPPIEAVIMAGGRGRRLMPLTDEVPKPMLPVGGRPMLEWIIDGLKRAGISRITITAHYKAEIIRRYFGNGWPFGVSISHLYEEVPTGTAGSLRMLPHWDSTILVINGDILTWVDFASMIKYHQEHKADLTVAVRKHDIQVPYGVVDMDGTEIRRLSEKPTLPYFVNAGIYLLEPTLRQHLGDEGYLDMTQLIDRALGRGRSIVGFPVTEYWADIGQLQDYERARDHVDAQRLDVEEDALRLSQRESVPIGGGA